MIERVQLALVKDGVDGHCGSGSRSRSRVEVEVEVTRKWTNCFSDAKESIAAPSCAILDFATTETATTRRLSSSFPTDRYFLADDN
jgi:hypothetical protein